MNQTYSDLSQLLHNSTPAEGFFSQLPEWIQQKAMAHSGQIRTQKELRRFAAQCEQEGE